MVTEQSLSTMPDPYNLDLTAAQINEALNAAYDSDKAPSTGDTNLVNSNRIALAIASESSARAAADSALEAYVIKPSVYSGISAITGNGGSLISESGAFSTSGSGVPFNWSAIATFGPFTLSGITSSTTLETLSHVVFDLEFSSQNNDPYTVTSQFFEVSPDSGATYLKAAQFMQSLSVPGSPGGYNPGVEITNFAVPLFNVTTGLYVRATARGTWSSGTNSSTRMRMRLLGALGRSSS